MARPRRRRLPALNSTIVTDDQGLGAALAGLLRRDASFRRSQRQSIKRQAALQRIASRRAWKLYLALEEVQVACLSDALDLVAKWAFAAGRRFERRRTR